MNNSEYENYNELDDPNLIGMYYKLDKNKYEEDLIIIEFILRKRFLIEDSKSLNNPEVISLFKNSLENNQSNFLNNSDKNDIARILSFWSISILFILGVLSYLDILFIPQSVILFLFGTIIMIIFFCDGFTGETYLPYNNVKEKVNPYLFNFLRWGSFIFGLFLYWIAYLMY